MNNQLPTKPVSKAPLITIIASPGAGKSSFAGMFPGAVFMQAENCSTVFENWDIEMQPLLFPRLPQSEKGMQKGKVNAIVNSTLEAAKSNIGSIYNMSADGVKRTLVIDTITTLNTMLEHEMCCKYGVDNIGEAAGGFQKGYDAVAEWHLSLLKGIEMLTDIGIPVIVLAHQGVHRMKNRPDVDDYTIYSLAMHEKSLSLYVNFSDAVMYIEKESFVKDKETNNKGALTKWGKKLETGNRKLITNGDGRLGYRDAKNRYGMPSEVPLVQGENPVLQYIKFFNQQPTQ